MSKDLTIRLAGRPKVSQDSPLGYKRLVRKFAVSGYRASKAGIEDPSNPLFLPVGTPDEEFPDHYLVNQQLEPAKTMDNAALVREFVKFRDTYHSETTSESGDFKRLARKFTVLRREHAVGYGDDSWDNHPQGKQDSDKSDDPWDYLPNVVLANEPVEVSYQDTGNSSGLFSEVGNTPAGLETPKVSIATVQVSLSNLMSDAATNDSLDIKWLRANAQVDMSNPGVDVWTVSWVAPVTDHWASGSRASGSRKSPIPTMVSFDFQGMKIMKFGSTASSGGPSTMHTYTSYVVGETPGATLTSSFGSSSNIQPSVSMDFNIVPQRGGWGAASFSHKLANAFYIQDTQAYLRFPEWYGDIDNDNAGTAVSKKVPYGMEFKYNNQEGFSAHPDQAGNLCHYKYSPIIGAGGNITWSHTYLTGLSGFSQIVGSSIKPIFSHNKERVWKISLVFAS
jgi:hypothetical protein